MNEVMREQGVTRVNEVMKEGVTRVNEVMKEDVTRVDEEMKEVGDNLLPPCLHLPALVVLVGLFHLAISASFLLSDTTYDTVQHITRRVRKVNTIQVVQYREG